MTTDTGLIQAAEKIRPLVAEHAAQADRERQLAPEVVAALKEAGFARHFVPSRWGGAEASFGEVTQAIASIGEECANAAWFASLSAYAGRFGAFLPEQGQAEIWGGGPDSVIVAALVPAGAAEEVQGGFHVKGRWGYCSGIDFADWALICGPAGDRAQAKFFAVPRKACTILPTWDSVGLRATTSHTIEVDTFVPSHMVFAFGQMASGRNPYSQAGCHTAPIRAVGNLAFIPPALGAGTGALNAAVAALRAKPHHSDVDTLLVRASAQIDAARLLVERNAVVADAGVFSDELLARSERDAALAGELLNEAVGALIRACGTTGFSESQSLQRFWRDTTCATSHVALRFETAAVKFYSAFLLGDGR
ncbi:acyl-CoA dehydrogenase family protein [Allorhizocola rhizosphaerae]|uniref:acyl-CoA dehydrogenase family protein n=1 Tax=Allorhizocola rhizosphaerae TaxID=1872709 RepID=UPI0013C2FAFE|nr:acyl-CoA dehydrogenase family protein [Allorhizocola rhizosphaerae]